MVTVVDYAVRENRQGEQFIALYLQGGLEMVKSQETKRYYATAKRCSVTSTFSEETAGELIGQVIPGRIIRQECEAYEYTIPESGETIKLAHSWVYSPEEQAVSIPGRQPIQPVQPLRQDVVEKFSKNGVHDLVDA